MAFPHETIARNVSLSPAVGTTISARSALTATLKSEVNFRDSGNEKPGKNCLLVRSCMSSAQWPGSFVHRVISCLELEFFKRLIAKAVPQAPAPKTAIFMNPKSE